MKIYIIYLVLLPKLILASDINNYMLSLLDRSQNNWIKVITPKLYFGVITQNNFNYKKTNTEFFIRLTWQNETVSLTKQRNIIKITKNWISINNKYAL